MIELYRCERMHANISLAQCDANRKGVKSSRFCRPPCLSCDGCPGLGDPVRLQINNEVEIMSRESVAALKKGDKFVCPGCGKHKTYEAGGLCARCNSRKRAAKRAATTAPVSPGDVPAKAANHPVVNVALPVIDRSPYEDIALEVAKLVQAKQLAYGDNFGKSGEVLRVLYPQGISLQQMDEALTIVRVVDKLFRIATDSDAFGESPWCDVIGYALLAENRRQG